VTQPEPTLPDEVIETLRQLLTDADRHQFAVGDFLIEVVDELAPKVPRSSIIRECSNKTGADPSTLRDRECMARWYPPDVRREFDMLTYSQLRACKYAGEHWRDWAEWAAANLPAPVALIRQKIKSNGHDRPAWCGRWERALELLEQVRDDTSAQPEVRRLCQWWLKMAEEKGVRVIG
jgi:hypothetical protein